MCGIAGKVSLGHVPPELVAAMCGRQEHRGPDSRGIHQGDAVALGIQRLRVIDLATGDQPIYNEDRTVAVILNGEIYNYRELRRGLESRGHTFRTAGDTEVIAHLYEERGPDLVRELNGMFAFAIWDERKRALLLARDRVGKKPLFYAEGDGSLSFASELRALMADDEVPREVDPTSIDCFLAYGYVPAPWSIWRGVRKLKPGHTLVWEGGRSTTEPYWSLDYSGKRTEGHRELEEELRRLLGAAVRRRMIADVPLGAFLSGGVDSSIVVSEMAAASPDPVRTFSIGFEEESYNELPQARAIAERFSTEHREFVIRPDAVEIIPRLVKHYGEPFADSSAIPSFYLSELTREHVTVALNGDGGDENFAGYLRHTANHVLSPLDALPPLARRVAAAVGRSLPHSGDRRGNLAYARRLLESMPEDPIQRYALHVSIFNGREREDLVRPEFARLVDPGRARAVIRRPWRAQAETSRLDTVLSVDTQTYLPDDLLVKIDIATMAHSLEARSPFLDHEVMEFAASLPAALKARMGRKKWLLRRAYRGRVPDGNLDGPKRGFAVPLGDWFRGDLREYARETLLGDAAASSEYLRREVVSSLLAEHEGGAGDHSGKIWSLLMLEEWLRDFGRQEASPRLAPLLPAFGPRRELDVGAAASETAKLASRVSVVIPTHNRSELVARAIKSVLGQTAQPGEVIVVDDASDDGTAAALAGFGDAIRVLRQDANVERGAARNIGAREARGDLVAFLDSDDEWEPEKLETQLARSDPARPSTTGIVFVDATGTSIGRDYTPPANGAGELVLSMNPYLGSPSSLIVPKEAFTRTGGFPEARRLQGSEDWLFLARLATGGWPIEVVPECLVRFRIHPQQSTAPARNLARSMWAACDWLDKERIGSARAAGGRRNYAATAIAAAFARERDWRESARWASRALRSGTPSARVRSAYRIARSGMGGLLRTG